ncbi:MAG TPA: hypothetical protein VF116_03340 [Ktedonobacterales bacterium]
MPNKYEREIEEILRNMDRTEPRPGLGNRIRAFNRPRERAPRQTRIVAPSSEVLFLIGIVLALIAAGLTFEAGYVALAGISINGVLAIVGFLFLAAGFVVGWRGRFRPVTSYKSASWRGDNIVELPRRRGPLSALATQARIVRLKVRYWRMHRLGQE